MHFAERALANFGDVFVLGVVRTKWVVGALEHLAVEVVGQGLLLGSVGLGGPLVMAVVMGRRSWTLHIAG